LTLVGPYLVACALLVVAGVTKAVRPANTARAIAPLAGGLGLRRTEWLVRGFAIVEAVIGVIAALLPQRVPAALVAASLIVFAAFVLYARRRGGVLATCGCFGTPDTPPTRTHVVVNLALAGCAATVSAAGSSSSLGSYLVRQPFSGAPLMVLCALCTWLVFLLLVDLPRLSQAAPSAAEKS
jgi:Methylamine utilisation protein MauE